MNLCLQKLLTLTLLIVLTGARANSAPMKSYCLTQTQSPKKLGNYNKPVSQNPLEVRFHSKGEEYSVTVLNNYLQLQKVEGGQSVMSIHAQQYEYGGIIDIQIVDNSWLWIDGDETDYTASLNLSGKAPRIENLAPLSDKYSSSCNFFQSVFGDCLRAQGVYSFALKRVFLTGHRKSLLGFTTPKTVEIVDNVKRPLKGNFSFLSLYRDFTFLNGAVFETSSREALFYDGETWKSLFKPSQEQRENSSYRRLWHIKETNLGRVFITNVGNTPHSSNTFLSELTKGGKMENISIPEEIDDGLMELIQLKNEEHIWGISRNSVLSESDNRMNIVATFSEPLYIEGSSVSATDDSISFLVRDESGLTRHYLVTQLLEKENCQFLLNPRTQISIE